LKAVGLGHILSHRNFGSIDDLLSFFIIKNNVSDLFLHFVSDIVSFLKQVNQLGENVVIIDDFSKLWEMPREPLLQTHAKSIDVFVQLLNESNGLNNWLVLPVDVGGALVPGEAVTQTELGPSHIVLLHLLHDFHEVGSNTSVQLGDGVVVCRGKSSLGEDSK
jgi:hypothetical protein